MDRVKKIIEEAQSRATSEAGISNSRRPFTSRANELLPIVKAGLHKFASTIDAIVVDRGTRGLYGGWNGFELWSTKRGFWGTHKKGRHIMDITVGHVGREGDVTTLLINGINRDKDIPFNITDDEWFIRILAEHYAGLYR